MNKEIISTTCILLIILLFQTFDQKICTAESRININRKIVVIDPGHGGNDNGIVLNSELYEKSLTLLLGKYTAELLKNKFNVILTRDRDTNTDLLKRTSFANIQKADIFISLHAKKRGTGSFVIFEPPAGTSKQRKDLTLNWDSEHLPHIKESKKAAKILAEQFSKKLNKDCYITEAPAILLKGAQMPAVIIEVLSMEDLMGETDYEKSLKQQAQIIAGSLEKILK